jgi:hypothetical protein
MPVPSPSPRGLNVGSPKWRPLESAQEVTDSKH